MGPDLAQALGESLYSLEAQVEGICTLHGTVPLQISTYPSLEWVLTSDLTHRTPPSIALSRASDSENGGLPTWRNDTVRLTLVTPWGICCAFLFAHLRGCGTLLWSTGKAG